MLTDTTPSSTRSEAAGSGRRGRALGRTALSLAAIIVLSIGGVALGAVSASAAPAAPGATTSPPNVQAPVVAPTITVADSASSRGRASGTATAGHSLRVLDPVHPQSSLCTATVAGDGSWSCAVALTSGANQTLTVRDLSDTTLPDVTSAPFSVLTAPVITSPAGIAVGAKVTGTGYAGATVTLSIDGSGSTTSQTASVSSSGAWQVLLPSAVPSGKYSISAVQRSSRVPAVGVSSASGPSPSPSIAPPRPPL